MAFVFLSLEERYLKEQSAAGHIICAITRLLSTLGYTMAIFLMMDHNQCKYLKFLNIVHYLKLHWVFCVCCKYIVTDQRNQIKESDDEKSYASTNEVTSRLNLQIETNDRNMNTPDSVLDTYDGSVQHQHLNIVGMELSLETVTINKEDHD